MGKKGGITTSRGKEKNKKKKHPEGGRREKTEKTAVVFTNRGT